MKRYGFAVIGLGKFGFYLAKYLSELGQEVLCIERQEALVEQAAPYVSDAVVADASKREVLENLGVNQIAKVIVSVGNLTQSILITLYLREIKAKYILAKANDEDHAKLLSLVGADEVLIPERNSARKMAQRLVTPSVVDFIPMLPEYCVAEVSPPDFMIGKTLAQLHLRRKYHVYVIAIRDNDTNKITMMPKAEKLIKKNEILYILGRKDDVERFSSLRA